ncbi:MAG: helix-turn-helix domain-containing protein [Elusimicrobia bacterium]|nr:helix-turn-helix domain-containing protein [Elusimicrobiota bacterium]
MTVQTLERKLKTFEEPVSHPLLRWLYLHLPPQPITSRKMHKAYADSVGILMTELELGKLEGSDRGAVTKYLKSVLPFVEQYEKKEYPSGSVSPEEMLRFFMEQHGLAQQDLAEELGGQPAVSYVLNGRRKLTREQIVRLARRFGVSEATFYPSGA